MDSTRIRLVRLNDRFIKRVQFYSVIITPNYAVIEFFDVDLNKRGVVLIRRPLFIGGAFATAVLCTLVYYQYRIPPGVAPQSDNGETIAWISLATAIVSMITAIVGLLQKVLESRGRGKSQ